MRPLILPAAAALALHGLLFFGLGDGRLETAPCAKPAARPLEMTFEMTPPPPAKAPEVTPHAQPPPSPERSVSAPPRPPQSRRPKTAPPRPPQPVVQTKPAAMPDRIEPLVPEQPAQPPAATAPAEAEEPEIAHPRPAPFHNAKPQIPLESVPSDPAAAAAGKVFKQSDVGRVDGIRKAVPRYRENPPPRYPSLAKRRGYEGTVILDVLVTPAGRATDLKIEQSSGHSVLDASAMTAVQDWVFEPARLGDHPVAMRVSIPVMFSLRE